MTYPNAYHGVKKIFTAQILKIIEGFFMFIVAITSFFSAGTAALESALNSSGEASMTLATIALGFIVAAGILAIIAYIMNIVGLRQGGIDEEGFRMGFIVACFASNGHRDYRK